MTAPSFRNLRELNAFLPKIRCVASDIDGTLTDEGEGAPAGALHPGIAGAIRDLRAQNKCFVLVTGRPAGFAWTLMQSLGADAAIAENGGIIFFANQPERAWHIAPGHENWHPLPEAVGNDHSAPDTECAPCSSQAHCTNQGRAHALFAELKEAGLLTSECRPTHDNLYRLCDFTFSVEGLSIDTLQTLRSAIEARGAGFIYSSIHAHIMPCRQSKGQALRWTLEHLGITPDQCITIGDSPNDETLFDHRFFPHSVGVLNLRGHAPVMCERPQYLTESKGGQGFLELLSLMRNGSEMVPAGKPRSEGATQQSNAAIEPNFPRLIVFFDGECVLCNVYADLLMGQLNRRNRTPAADLSVALAPLQGKTARKLLPPHLQIPPYPSLISCQLAPGPSQTLTQPVQELNVRSEAILCILPYLGRGWRRFARIIHFVPRGIRDTIYDWVARNRYVLFGRRSTCRLPTQEEKKWILD